MRLFFFLLHCSMLSLTGCLIPTPTKINMHPTAYQRAYRFYSLCLPWRWGTANQSHRGLIIRPGKLRNGLLKAKYFLAHHPPCNIATYWRGVETNHKNIILGILSLRHLRRAPRRGGGHCPRGASWLVTWPAIGGGEAKVSSRLNRSVPILLRIKSFHAQSHWLPWGEGGTNTTVFYLLRCLWKSSIGAPVVLRATGPLV